MPTRGRPYCTAGPDTSGPVCPKASVCPFEGQVDQLGVVAHSRLTISDGAAGGGKSRAAPGRFPSSASSCRSEGRFVKPPEKRPVNNTDHPSTETASPARPIAPRERPRAIRRGAIPAAGARACSPSGQTSGESRPSCGRPVRAAYSAAAAIRPPSASANPAQPLDYRTNLAVVHLGHETGPSPGPQCAAPPAIPCRAGGGSAGRPPEGRRSNRDTRPADRRSRASKSRGTARSRISSGRSNRLRLDRRKLGQRDNWLAGAPCAHHQIGHARACGNSSHGAARPRHCRASSSARSKCRLTTVICRTPSSCK